MFCLVQYRGLVTRYPAYSLREVVCGAKAESAQQPRALFCVLGRDCTAGPFTTRSDASYQQTWSQSCIFCLDVCVVVYPTSETVAILGGPQIPDDVHCQRSADMRLPLETVSVARAGLILSARILRQKHQQHQQKEGGLTTGGLTTGGLTTRGLATRMHPFSVGWV